MAISTNFLLSTTATATNTTTVVATTSLPQNCHTVIIFNPDGTNSVYVAVGVADGGDALDVASSTVIPAGGSLTLGIGPETFRPTSTDDLAFSTSAGTIAVNISYICSNKV